MGLPADLYWGCVPWRGRSHHPADVWWARTWPHEAPQGRWRWNPETEQRTLAQMLSACRKLRWRWSGDTYKDGWGWRKREAEKKRRSFKTCVGKDTKILTATIKCEGNPFFNREEFSVFQSVALFQSVIGWRACWERSVQMKGCFGQRETVCIDGGWWNGKRKRGGEQMGAAGFDHRYRMQQLCSWEMWNLTQANQECFCVSRKHFTPYGNTVPWDEGYESDWPGSAEESLWATVLVHHGEEEAREPQRKVSGSKS